MTALTKIPARLVDLAGPLDAGQLPATAVQTTGSYADPSWITSLAASKITGTTLTMPTVQGSTAAGGSLLLQGTGNASKGPVYLNSTNAGVDATGRLFAGGTPGSSINSFLRILGVGASDAGIGAAVGNQVCWVEMFNGRGIVEAHDYGTNTALPLVLGGASAATSSVSIGWDMTHRYATYTSNTITINPDGWLAPPSGVALLAVKGTLNQAGDLQQWQGSSGAWVARVDVGGNVTAPALYGSSSAAGNVTIKGTSHATPGTVYLNGTGTGVDANGRLFVGGTPGSSLPAAIKCVVSDATDAYFGAATGNKIAWIEMTGGCGIVAAHDYGTPANLPIVVGGASVAAGIGLGQDATHRYLGCNGNTVTINPDNWLSPSASPFAIAGCTAQAGPLLLLQQRTTVTPTLRNCAAFDAQWATSTDGAQKGRAVVYACDSSGTNREGLRVESSGTQPLIGFLGAPAVARAANPGTAVGTDAAIINALVSIIRNLGFAA